MDAVTESSGRRLVVESLAGSVSASVAAVFSNPIGTFLPTRPSSFRCLSLPHAAMAQMWHA